ncbi:MAG: hypothetical protein AAF391_03055, partial [Bacteroidota bacterium]
MKFSRQDYALLALTLSLYTLFLFYYQPADYDSCELCDGNQYLKLYWFFEEGVVSQIKYPFYTRPVVPFLTSMIPGNDPYLSFHIINFIFVVLGVFSIKKLWNHLSINTSVQWIGFGWLLLHWASIIRLNLYDFVTIDMPVYFFQALGLLLFFRKKFKWFYLITPIAILQKESFLGVIVVLLIAHIWETKAHWFKDGQHLLYATLLGVLVQLLVLEWMPPQSHKWHPLLTIALLS